MTNINPVAPTITVGAAAGPPIRSSASCDLALTDVPSDFPRSGHVIKGFHENLVGIGPICDAKYSVLFTEDDVRIISPNGQVVLNGWRETTGHKLWRMSLLPSENDLRPFSGTHDVSTASLAAFSAYDLPSVNALVRYFHAAAGFPVRDTWLKAIKAGNFRSWPGLTLQNASKYCPVPIETLKGHMVQTRQNVRSTKPKRPKPSPSPIITSTSVQTEKPSNELHIRFESISKLYTDDTGRFPVRSRGGNQYVMIAYHCDSNAIFAMPFKTRADRHRLPAYNSIMQRLKDRNLLVDLQILDNEASRQYKQTITADWGIKFQLVPPHIHRRNAAERAIRTFKAHFLAILAGIADDFPKRCWDLLVPQTELTLNLLRQSRLRPEISAYEHVEGPFDYNATPLGPLGCAVLIHKKTSQRHSWDFRAREGWSIGAAMQSYRCDRVIAKDSLAVCISDTVEYRHAHLTIPTVTNDDRILHGLQNLTGALGDVPTARCDAQLKAIGDLRAACHRWLSPAPSAKPSDTTSPSAPVQASPRRSSRLKPSTAQPPMSQLPITTFTLPPPMTQPAPRVAINDTTVPVLPLRPAPRVVIPPPVIPDEPIARRTRSYTPAGSAPISSRTRSKVRQNLAAFSRGLSVLPSQAARRKYPAHLLALWCTPRDELACPVFDSESGSALEYRQLRRNPKFKDIWESSYSNELGRLCQGVGVGSKGPKKQRVEGTDTYRLIQFTDIPRDRRKEICFSRVVCEIKPHKEDPNRTRITVAGNRIIFPGEVATPTASLELVKLFVNSVLSRPNAKFCSFDIANFYLGTPMERPEYVKIKLDDIPQEFIDEYNLLAYAHNGWIFFEVIKGCYGLPQSGKLANDLLRKRLNSAGYHEATTTPGLWRHKWRPIQFCLLVDDFGIEYVGEKHALHLKSTLQEHYSITEDWEGKKFAGIDLEWNYATTHKARSCRLSIKNYIRDLLLRVGHPPPAKPQLSPHKHREITYGAKEQYTHVALPSPKLDEKGVKRVQEVVGALLFYGRAVDNKLLVAINAIGIQQANATEATKAAVATLLDYLATYPDDGTLYRASDMVLAAHADAGFHNESKGRSRAGAHIFLSENVPFPRWNGAILTIAQVIKFVMTSAAEAELGALFIAAQKLVPLRQTLCEMGWPQPPTPVQTDNTTAAGVVNKTLVSNKLKSMDLRFHWLRCRTAQDQFRFYWDKGPNNWGDYSTKHHPPVYHESKRELFAGAASLLHHALFPRLCK